MTEFDPASGPEVHDLDQNTFLEEVHSFEFWFQAVEGYLSGTSYGHAAVADEETLDAAERERLLTVLSNYCVGETAALEGASGLVAFAPNRQTKVFLSTQVADEGRHLEVFLHRMRELGAEDPEAEVERRASPALKLFRTRLLELVASKDWDAALFAQNVILESLEFVVFHTHMQDADTVTAQVLDGVVKDERRHMGFGENEIGRRLAQAPHRRARIAELRRSMDHLVLDMLAETAVQLGIERSEQDKLGRHYLETVERLGVV